MASAATSSSTSAAASAAAARCSADRFSAGTELAAGMFANDALPEETARELQAVAVAL